MNVAIYILIIALTIAILFCIWLVYQLKDRFDRKIYDLERKYKKREDTLSKEIGDAFKQMEATNGMVLDGLKENIEKINIKVNAINKKREVGHHTPIIEKRETQLVVGEGEIEFPKGSSKNSEEAPQEEFYMSTPNLDGSFDISSQTEEFKPTRSLYKFWVFRNNKSLAQFAFFSDDSDMREAVSYPQTYIDPVCEADNISNPGITKRIITTKNGIAKKEGDKWVVSKENKARIKYE